MKKIHFVALSLLVSVSSYASRCPSQLERIGNSTLLAQCQFVRSVSAASGQSAVYEDFSGRRFQTIQACVYGVLNSYDDQILFDAKLLNADPIFESDAKNSVAASRSDYRSFLNRNGTTLLLPRDGWAKWDVTQAVVAIKNSGIDGDRRVGYFNFEDLVIYSEKNRSLTLEHRTTGFMGGKLLYKFLFDCRLETSLATRR